VSQPLPNDTPNSITIEEIMDKFYSIFSEAYYPASIPKSLLNALGDYQNYLQDNAKGKVIE
jgi:hypothetical protein